MDVSPGSVNVSVPFYFVDDVGGTAPGEPTTGLLFSDIETGGSASYQRQGAARVDFTLKTLANAASAYDAGGFILVDDTEMPGVYRCDVPDAAFATGVDFVIIYLRAASAKNTITRPLKIDLKVISETARANLETAGTNYSATRGLAGTALPAVAADGVGGLPISDAGGLDLDNLVLDGMKDGGLILSRSTIETVTSQTQFIIPATDDAPDNDAYNGALAVFIDGSDPNQRSFQLITDYAASSRTVTVANAPKFTVTNADTLVILAGATAKTVWDRVLTGATHNIATSAGRRLRNIQDFGIYDLASVWVDEVAGQSSGTIDGEDGTVTNRSDDFDNAQTIAASVNLDNIHIQNGNTITLAATLNGFNVWSGAPNTRSVTWSLVLNNQNIGNSLFSAAEVSGVGTGTTPSFIGCHINTATLPPSRLSNCSLLSTLTLGSAGAYRLIDCYSGVAGASTPTVNMGLGIGATTVEFRRWSGGLTLTNIEAGDVISIDTVTGGTITLTLSGGTVEVRGAGQKNLVVNGSSGTVNVAGNIGVITDNSGGAVTINKTWAINRSLITGGDYSLNTTASGNIGIDWGNVENQGTTVGLSATTVFTTTTNTDMVGTANAALASALTTHDGKLDTLLTRIPAALFNGITSVAQWLGIIAGKQTGNATALTEIKATGAGSGTFNETTDSQEALRERGDVAWITATGFNAVVPDVAGTAAGLHSTTDGKIDALVSTVGVAGVGLTDLGGMSTAMKAQVEAEANDALVALHLDHLLAVDYNPAGKPGIATALFNELIESDGGVSRFTANALEQAPGGGNVTVGAFTTSALLELIQTDTGETTASAGSVGKIAQGTASGLTAEAVRIEMDANSTKFAAILEDSGTSLPAGHDVLADAISAIPAIGAGATQTTVLIKQNGLPVDGVEVWFSTDEAGLNVVHGTFVTDAFGLADFGAVDLGTYYVHRQKAGLDFTVQTITVE